MKPDIEVSADDGIVFVKTKAPLSQEENLVNKMRRLTEDMQGVKELRIKVLPPDSSLIA